MEASHGRGAPFSSKGGAQAEVATWCSPLLFVSWADLVCMPLGYLNPLWGSTSWEEWVFPGSIASLPLSSLPFVVDRVGSGMLGRWRSRKSGLGLRNGGLSLGCFLRCFSPRLGLKQLLKGCSWLTLDSHLFRNNDVSLEVIYLNWGIWR